MDDTLGIILSNPPPTNKLLTGQNANQMTKAIKFNPFPMRKKCLTFCGYFMWKMYCITTTKAEKREKLEGTRKKKNKEKGSFNYLAPACVSI